MGTILSTRPMRGASAASIILPEEQLLAGKPRPAHQARGRRWAPPNPAVMPRPFDFGLAEAGPLSDAMRRRSRRQGQFTAAAKGKARDHGDDGLAQGLYLGEYLLSSASTEGHTGFRFHGLHLRDVRSGGKSLLSALTTRMISASPSILAGPRPSSFQHGTVQRSADRDGSA